MTRLHQKSIADLRAEAYAEMASLEKYEPTEHEKSQGKWVVFVEKLLPDGEPDLTSTMHIMPTFGTIHYISDKCWCGPAHETRDNDDGVPYEYYRHEASQ